TQTPLDAVGEKLAAWEVASHSNPDGGEHAITIAFGRDNKDAYPRAQTLTFERLVERFAEVDTARGRLKGAEYHALKKAVRSEKRLRDEEKDGEYFVAA